jgi:transposase
VSIGFADSGEWPLMADSVEKVAPPSGLRQNSRIGCREARSMMGQLSGGQDRLFYSFNLEDHIPANHLLRSIDQCLDLSDLRHHLADFYSPIRRPSIDPELMIRMLIVGSCDGIRSERRLSEVAHLNLAYRWFCRLGLEDEVPNHSTFSKSQHGRFRDSDLFRWLFHEVLHRCMDAGLVKGEGFAVDASIIKADASRQRGVTGDEQVNWSDSALSTRAVREYLEALDEEALAETLSKRLSLTDPQARWTAAPGGPAFYAYSTNYLIDTEHGVIVDVEPTPAHRTAEVESTKTMIDRFEAQLDIKPERLIGDTAYVTAPILAWMVEEKDIEPHVPVWDKTERKNDSFSSNDFHRNEAAEEYLCPAGNALGSEWRAFKNERSHVTKANTIIFRSRHVGADAILNQAAGTHLPTRILKKWWYCGIYQRPHLGQLISATGLKIASAPTLLYLQSHAERWSSVTDMVNMSFDRP